MHTLPNADAVPAAKTTAEPIGRYLERSLMAASFAAAAAFIVIGIQHPLWLDEANSVLISSQPFSGIVAALRVDNNFPLFYFLLALWMRLFGDSEIALRALSALFYVGGAGAAYLIGRDLSAQRRAAGYSAFFYMTSLLAIRNAQNIRMYSLLGMLSAFGLLAFLRLMRGDCTWRTRALLVGVHTAGLLTHPWFGFVLLAEAAVALLLEKERFRQWIAVVLPVALLFGLLWGPAFLRQLRDGATDWMPPLQRSLWVEAPAEFYSAISSCVLYILAAIGWIRETPAKRKLLLRKNRVLLLFVFFAVCLALPLIVSSVRPIYWPGRYVIIALAPLAVILGVVLSSTLPSGVLPLAGLLLLIYSVGYQVAHRNDVPEAELKDGQSDRTTAQFLLDHAAPGDAIIFTSLTRAAADYYFRRSGAKTRFLEISFPGETAQHLGWMDLDFSANRRSRLEAEASSIICRLQTVEAAGRTIWMYDGYAWQISAILKQKLDSMHPPARVYSLSGPYHKRLLAYFALRERATANPSRPPLGQWPRTANQFR
jgi:mannosyltransferase